MKKLDQAVVAVCKLCCPTCMELFHVLRNGVQIQENLWVRGHHSTVFLVELPDWLPADVLQDMVLWYRQHLSEALQRFSRLKHVQLRHGRRPMYSASARPLNEEKNLGIPSEYITTWLSKNYKVRAGDQWLIVSPLQFQHNGHSSHGRFISWRQR